MVYKGKTEDYKKIQFIGNLPFNVATALLIDWLKAMTLDTGFLSHPNVELILMFQKEVADV